MKINRIILAGIPVKLIVKDCDLNDFEKLTKKELIQMGFEIKKEKEEK